VPRPTEPQAAPGDEPNSRHARLRPVLDRALRRMLDDGVPLSALSQRERRAVEAVLHADLDGVRSWVLARLPLELYLALCGRARKTVLDQARRYGMPLGGARKTWDLAEVLRWLHDMLAQIGRNPQALRALRIDRTADDDTPQPTSPTSTPTPGTLSLGSTGDPATDKVAAEARLRELDLLKRMGEVVELRAVRDALGPMGATMRRLGEQLQRRFGPDALDLVQVAIDDFERDAERLLGDQADGDGEGGAA
jgi:hypothetical protein